MAVHSDVAIADRHHIVVERYQRLASDDAEDVLTHLARRHDGRGRTGCDGVIIDVRQEVLAHCHHAVISSSETADCDDAAVDGR